jgi:hypothetical protein
MLLLDTMAGKEVNRAPSVPKIWIDLAANLLHRDYSIFFDNPGFATQTVIEAAIDCECDGARVFLFPNRDTRREGKDYYHYHKNKKLGRIDVDGGWATIFDDPDDIDFSDPMTMIPYHYFKSGKRIIKNTPMIKRLEIPSLQTFHNLYGEQVDESLKIAEDKICPIGDCNSGTLAFCVSMLGMEDALFCLYDEIEFIRALMEKGIQLCITQAKFMLDKGIRILRYNDSVANMTVISPDTWREFIKPNIREFCSQVHAYCPEAKIYCHICGDIRPIVKDIIETGLDCIAPLDPLGNFSVKDIRNIAGDTFMLMGGVNTLSFINQLPEKIMAEAERCIEEGFTNGHYAVGSGCAVPRTASREALQALAKASKKMRKI